MLAEGVGGAAWGPLLPHLRRASRWLVGSDADPLAFGLYEVDHGFLCAQDKLYDYLARTLEVCRAQGVEIVIPILGPALVAWAGQRDGLASEGIQVCISPPEVVAMCLDKWLVHGFFQAHGIPTPRTSLQHEFELVKPRHGEGSRDVFRARPGGSAQVDMNGYVSQELLSGEEYSVDALCDAAGQPVYVVPRLRCAVSGGRSVVGRVVDDEEIVAVTRRILAAARFLGPVNVQCFRTEAGLRFTDLNPRISGGLSLSFAATENWFRLLPRLLRGEKIRPRRVVTGLVMMRHLADTIVDVPRLID
jgi:carbamoyl-phosphate synthase large subunit